MRSRYAIKRKLSFGLTSLVLCFIFLTFLFSCIFYFLFKPFFVSFFLCIFTFMYIGFHFSRLLAINWQHLLTYRLSARIFYSLLVSSSFIPGFLTALKPQISPNIMATSPQPDTAAVTQLSSIDNWSPLQTKTYDSTPHATVSFWTNTLWPKWQSLSSLLFSFIYTLLSYFTMSSPKGPGMCWWLLLMLVLFSCPTNYCCEGVFMFSNIFDSKDPKYDDFLPKI